MEEEPGFRTIGDLTSKIVSSLTPSASTPTPSAPTSPTGGTPRPVPTASNEIGRPLGASGVVEILHGSIQNLMALGDPEETDLMLAESWRQRFGCSPAEERESIYDGPHGYDEKLVRVVPPPRFDEQLWNTLLAANARVPDAVLTKELARLKIGTVGRKMGDADLEAWIEVAGEELEFYPPDVVKAACRQALRWDKWTPSVHELVLACDQLVRYRRLLKTALEAAPR